MIAPILKVPILRRLFRGGAFILVRVDSYCTMFSINALGVTPKCFLKHRLK